MAAKKITKRGRKYDWGDLAHRYIVQREWITLIKMAEALKAWGKESGKPVPSYSLICKRAMDEEWNGQRVGLESAAMAQAKDEVVERDKKAMLDAFEKHRALGGGMVAMGGNYIKELEALAAKARANGDLSVAGAITSTYEALAFIRVGAMLEMRAVEGLARGSSGPTKEQIENMPDAPGGRMGGADELIVDDGVVFLPAQLDEATWDKQRRKNLGAQADPDPSQSQK